MKQNEKRKIEEEEEEVQIGELVTLDDCDDHDQTNPDLHWLYPMIQIVRTRCRMECLQSMSLYGC